MRTAAQIYEEYRIPSWLQEHQLRVAAVAKYVAERIAGTDVDLVVQGGLFHDMGNILKFDFSSDLLLSRVKEEGVEHWRAIYNDFRANYGDEEHAATHAIGVEIGLREDALQLMSDMGFSKAERVARHGSWELKCVEYGDMRVSPDGITSIELRLAEGRARYLKRIGGTFGGSSDGASFERNKAFVLDMERQLVAAANFDVLEISDASLAMDIESLKKYAIS